MVTGQLVQELLAENERLRKRLLQIEGHAYKGEVTTAPIADGKGDPQVSTEATRFDSEFVRGVLDSLPEHVVVLDDKGVVREVNLPWERFAKKHPGQRLTVPVGANYLDACRLQAAAGDFHAEQVLRGLDDVLAGKRRQFVLEYPCPSVEDRRWFLMHAQRMLHGPPGIILSHVDITDRKRAEHELAEIHQRLSESHALLDTLAAKAPVGLGFIDLQSRIVRANDTLAAISGLPMEAHIGRTMEELDVEFWSECARFYRRALAGEQTLNVEVSNERRAAVGMTRHWLMNCYPVTVDHQTIGVGIVVVEVTSQKRTEQALKDADRHKDEFLATLAHELRNPLAPIRAAVEVLKLRAMHDTDLQVSRDVIDRQVKQMARLLEDLLDVSRISRNTLELRLEPIQLIDVLQLAMETSRPVIEAGRHRLTLTLPDQPIALNADAVRLAQVFSNLLNNSAKYTEPGGHIHLSAERRDDMALVSVKDNGIGIAPEMQPRVFEIFSQATSALQRSQGGLGIGLSLVKGLLDLHGATIDMVSEGLDRGCEFIVRLPVATHMQAPKPHMLLEKSSSPPKRTCRILVVDDIRDNADTLGIMLKVLGNEVSLAYGGEEALKIAEELRPHIVLLDIGMPKVNGIEVARRIQEHPWGRGITLVALTGWAREEDRERTKEAGFHHHLAKPVASATLMELIETIQRDRGEFTHSEAATLNL